ncbi:unnamed protein product [Sphagnum compactum]
MGSLSLLTLNSPKRAHPHNCGCGVAESAESGSAFSSPYASAPSSPRRACFFREEVEEAPLGEVRAAIPFIWEHVPGTPIHDDHLFSFAERGREKEDGAHLARQENSFKHLAEEETCQVEEAAAAGLDVCANGDSDHVVFEDSPSSESEEEFDFGAKLGTTKEENSIMSSTAEELFLKGHMLPLSLPPRLQSLKHVLLQTSDSSRSDSSSSADSSSCGSFHQGRSSGAAAAVARTTSYSFSSSSPKSPRGSSLSGSRFLALFGFSRTPRETADVENMMKESAGRNAERIGHKRRKSRSLSPSRYLFDTNPGESSSSSASSSSSKESEVQPQQANLDLSFTDLALYPGDQVSILQGLNDIWPQQYKEEKENKKDECVDSGGLLPHTDSSNVESANNMGQVISLLASSETCLPSLSPIPEVDKSSEMINKNQDIDENQGKNQDTNENQDINENQDCATRTASLKESTGGRSNSRLVWFTRFPFHTRKLKSSSRSAVAPHDLRIKPFMFNRLRQTFFGGCMGLTPTTDEQEFAGIQNMSSQKKL